MSGWNESPTAHTDLEQGWDECLEAVVVAPPGVLVQHPDEDGMLLAAVPDPDLNLSPEAGDAFDVLRRLKRRPKRRRRRCVEQERRRHPVDLARVELERVDADFSPQKFQTGLKKFDVNGCGGSCG